LVLPTWQQILFPEKGNDSLDRCTLCVAGQPGDTTFSFSRTSTRHMAFWMTRRIFVLWGTWQGCHDASPTRQGSPLSQPAHRCRPRNFCLCRSTCSAFMLTFRPPSADRIHSLQPAPPPLPANLHSLPPSTQYATDERQRAPSLGGAGPPGTYRGQFLPSFPLSYDAHVVPALRDFQSAV
jgi:hypothetical protein